MDTSNFQVMAGVARETPISAMEPHEILSALAQLELAVASHAEWLKNWHLSVVCTGAREKSSVSDTFDPHLPSFDNWISGDASLPFRETPLFDAIATTHSQMFNHSKILTRAAANQRGVLSTDYDLFMSSVIALNKLIGQLQSNSWNQLASVDPLTGVSNRNTMNAVLDAERSRSARTSHPCSLAMMDLDHFKETNDLYGHLAGDTVLRVIADAVVASLRPYDHIFRYGGDEFLICLPNTSTENAHLVLDRLRERIANMEISVSSDKTCRQTVSIGIAEIGANTSVKEAVQSTDDALYNVKETGRNAVIIATE